MSDQFEGRKAAEAAQGAPLGDDARALLAGDPDLRRYLETLLTSGLFADAVRTLAHALPKREAVWWACQCARQAHGATPPGPIAAAIAAAERWAAETEEPNRREAEASAIAAGVGTPAGCAAMAAFWGGGSLGPPNIQDVPPPEGLTARGVSGSVLLAAVLSEPEKAAEKFRQFVALGLEVASGANCWSTTVPPRLRPSPTAPIPAGRPISGPSRRVDTWE